jgi:hypothetical protein
MTTYSHLLHSLHRRTPSALHLAVIDRATGKAIAQLNCETGVHGRFLSELRKVWRKAEAVFGPENEHVHEVVVTLTDRLQLMRLLPDRRHLLYVAADVHSTNASHLQEVVSSTLRPMGALGAA